MKSWPVDAANPGEVLACAGLAHLAWRKDPNARTGFRVAAGGEVRFEAPAPPRALALERLGPDRLRLAGVELDWWRAWGLNPALRTWAGRQSTWTVHRALAGAAEGADSRDWPTVSAPSRARLHLDPVGSWNTLTLGFSANEHRAAPVCCRPLVELLASLGLGAFPLRRSGDRFSYLRPAHLARYPETHLSLAWTSPVRGPLALGAGARYGLGLLVGNAMALTRPSGTGCGLGKRNGRMTTSRAGAGETRALRPLALPARAPGTEAVRRGLFVDSETTGLNAERDVLIELALLPFTYTLEGGVAQVLEDEQQVHRNDPGRPLPEEVTHLTGLTDEDLRGERVDVARAGVLFEGSHLVVAHNARLDRPFVEAALPAARARPWACSRAEIPWTEEGFASQALHYLPCTCGVFARDRHRALADCEAGGWLLAPAPPRLRRHRPRRPST